MEAEGRDVNRKSQRGILMWGLLIRADDLFMELEMVLVNVRIYRATDKRLLLARRERIKVDTFSAVFDCWMNNEIAMS